MAESSTMETDQPLSPVGRVLLQPNMYQVINCAIAVEGSLDVDAIKAEILNSINLQPPRFRSLMVRDSGGLEHWRITQIDVDSHFIIHHHPLTDDPSVSDEDAVNDYMADLSITPLPTDKPLWEIHLLMAHKTAVSRVHHALGDGISLMSMFLSSCRRSDDPSQRPSIDGVGSASSAPRRRWSVWTLIKMLWYTLFHVLDMTLRALWRRDKPTVLRGGEGVELWPRRLATARFRLDDMKIVKRAVPDVTINDVLFGVISCGLSKYLDIRSPKAPQEGLQITGVAMVNIRPESGLQDMSKLMKGKSGTRWGNKFGMFLLPVHYHKSSSDPLNFVGRAKAMIDKKKLSLEAPLSFITLDFFMSVLGAKFASILNYRIFCNTTFTISNIIGPREEITIVGNPVKHIRVTSSSLPHAITMHMLSYAGRAELQILVAKEIIPDPKVLARCFEDALLDMKIAAEKLMIIN